MFHLYDFEPLHGFQTLHLGSHLGSSNSSLEFSHNKIKNVIIYFFILFYFIMKNIKGSRHADNLFH